MLNNHNLYTNLDISNNYIGSNPSGTRKHYIQNPQSNKPRCRFKIQNSKPIEGSNLGQISVSVVDQSSMPYIRTWINRHQLQLAFRVRYHGQSHEFRRLKGVDTIPYIWGLKFIDLPKLNQVVFRGDPKTSWYDIYDSDINYKWDTGYDNWILYNNDPIKLSGDKKRFIITIPTKIGLYIGNKNELQDLIAESETFRMIYSGDTILGYDDNDNDRLYPDTYNSFISFNKGIQKYII